MTKENRKPLAIILSIVLCVVIALGLCFAVGCSETEPEADATEQTEQVQEFERTVESFYIQDQTTCKMSNALVYRFKIVDQKTITALRYTIDNGEETTVEGTETKLDGDLSEYDSGVKTIELTKLIEGTHVLTFYLYQDTARTRVYTHVFDVVA